jgi:hypothetical protein
MAELQKGLPKFDCSDLERAFHEETPELLAALEQHATSCISCRTELAIWREISAAALTMHKEWESPELWPRIENTLQAEIARPRGWRSWISVLGLAAQTRRQFRWQMALATMVLVAVSGMGAWLLLHHGASVQTNDAHLLTDQAVKQVEQAQKAYEQSIDKLAKLAEPRLDAASTSLLVNYREKLNLLDAAISECRTNLQRNHANAYLRNELLSFYQEKQQTLEQVLREE